MPPDPPTRLCILYICSFVLRLLSDIYCKLATNARRPGNAASARTQTTASHTRRTNPHFICMPLPSSISGSAPAVSASTGWKWSKRIGTLPAPISSTVCNWMVLEEKVSEKNREQCDSETPQLMVDEQLSIHMFENSRPLPV